MKMPVWFVFVLGALSAAGEVFVAKVGGKVTLKCGVSSYRRSLQWHHGNDFLHSVDQRGFPRKGSAELVQRSVVRQTNLEISSVRETDAGRFTCSADGTRREHTLSVFSVLVSVKPSAVLKLNDEATLQCEVKGQHHGCEVKWRSPNTYSLTNTSTVQLKPVKTSHNGPWLCIVTCGRNTFSERLAITVQEPPTTTKSPPKLNGKSEKPCGTNCGNDDASPRLLGLAWWVWVAIGVGCLVAILLMVCVIVLCVRVKRRKKRFLKMKGQQRPRHKKYCQCDHPTAAAKPKQGRRREKPSALPLHPA
uniref:Ig-like domain-containing protein n=1 Tax=Astatotilapia calliptera TaxID=8154 RepID=A0AAX7SUU4_ASTCA